MDNVNHQPTRKKLKLSQRILLSLIILIALVGIASMVLFATMLKEVPELNPDNFIYSENAKIYDINGEFYQELQSRELRENVSLDQIPEHVQNAFISIEDQRFRKHHGVDALRFGRAVLETLTSRSLEGPGGSTITQQLIKLTHLTDDKTISRKFQEMVLANKLENIYDKNQILEAYLNKINFSQAWGIEAASRVYFNKNVSEITVAQGAVLAAMPRLPSYYTPYSYTEGDNPEMQLHEDGQPVYNENNKERAFLVLDKMLELEYIDQGQFDQAKEEVATGNIGLVYNPPQHNYSYFTDSVYSQVLADLKSTYHYTDEEASDLLLNGSLEIFSTVDPRIQTIMEEKSRDEGLYPAQSATAAEASQAKSGETGQPVNYIPQVGMTVINNETGYVSGIVGGREEKTNLSMNRATRLFQPGSATKPLTTYGPGIDTGAITLGTTFEDIPIDYQGWQPGNADGGYAGPTTVRAGLAQSKNIVAVQACVVTGVNTAAEYAEKLGLEVVEKDEQDNTDLTPAAFALGGYTHGQSSLAMTSAFSTFPNQGNRIEPTFYTKVVDRNGNIILEKKQKKIPVYKPQTAFLITDVLKQVVQGGTTNIAIPNQPVAGKTGTTDDYRHAWFCGYTPQYTMGVWYGYDNNVVEVGDQTYYLNIDVAGGSMPGPAGMFQAVMTDVSAPLPAEDFPQSPGGLVTADIDRISGKLATDLTAQDPRGSMVISEMFIDGTVPATRDDWHIAVNLDISTNAYPSTFCPKELVKNVVRLKKPTNRFPQGITPIDPNYVTPDEVPILAPPEGYTCPLHASPIDSGLSDTLKIFVDGQPLNKKLDLKVGQAITLTVEGPNNEATQFAIHDALAKLEPQGNTAVITANEPGNTKITVTQVVKDEGGHERAASKEIEVAIVP
ncbi:MAG: hypothetical protein GX127_07680 [Eubacteriaceae bacterium]|nr:hypothetical protein [Eubacteriaceae bacterium]